MSESKLLNLRFVNCSPKTLLSSAVLINQIGVNMQITLRKANAIQNAIHDTIRSIDIKLNVELNEFQDAATVLADANTQLYANDARREALLLALYNIRGLVGVANSSSGIDLNLAKAAFLDKRVIQLEDIARVPAATDLQVLTGKLDKIKTRVTDETRYGISRDTVTTTIVSQEQIDAAKDAIKQLKKQKLALTDQVLELNIKTEIPLTEDVVNTLKSEGIL
jgi:hypothetical protein